MAPADRPSPTSHVADPKRQRLLLVPNPPAAEPGDPFRVSVRDLSADRFIQPIIGLAVTG
jgi:hypothetical protein